MKKNFLLILSALLILILSTIISYFLFSLLFNNPRPQKQHLTTNTIKTTQKKSQPKKIISNIKPTSTKKVWETNNDENIEVKLPSIEEGHQVFLNIRKAVQNRDYNLFKENASAETIWNTQYNLETVGMSEDGQHYIKKITTQDGKDYFEKYAPGLMPYQIPTNNDLFQPQKVEWSELEKKTDDIIIGDNKEAYLAIRDQWEKVVAIFYQINTQSQEYLIKNSDQNYDGYVILVYDNNQWKYHSQEWDTKHQENTTVNTIPDYNRAIKIHKVSKNSYQPQNIDINLGDKIVFKNVTGTLMSNNDIDNPWNTTFLNNQHYELKPKQKGAINYSIYFLNQAFEGEINVH